MPESTADFRRLRLGVVGDVKIDIVALAEDMRTSLLAAVLVTAVLSSTVRSKPHIVFILQDDLGHYDVAFNGNTNNSFVTGNISSLAREGIILSHHYVH